MPDFNEHIDIHIDGGGWKDYRVKRGPGTLGKSQLDKEIDEAVEGSGAAVNIDGGGFKNYQMRVKP